ncbi:MAG: response regulator [Candidatus Magnetomorum sp.]|nr:response regulator [Candidatus Magnetomorum sp.]
MSKKIVIIDDEPDICTYLTAALEDYGFNSQSVHDHQSFMPTIESVQPDLIILDIMMPGRSGISMYKELKNHKTYPSVAVIMMSGMSAENEFSPEGVRNLLHDASIPLPEGFLEKPIQIPELIQMINDILSKE